MFEPNELILVLLASAVVISLIFNLKNLKKITYSRTLLVAFFLIYLGCLFTLLENFIFQGLFNHLEHISYLIGYAALFKWVFHATQEGKIGKEPRKP